MQKSPRLGTAEAYQASPQERSHRTPRPLAPACVRIEGLGMHCKVHSYGESPKPSCVASGTPEVRLCPSLRVSPRSHTGGTFCLEPLKVTQRPEAFATKQLEGKTNF